MPSTQVAPFRQGLEWHTSVSARNQGLPLGLWEATPPTGELVSLLVQEGISVVLGGLGRAVFCNILPLQLLKGSRQETQLTLQGGHGFSDG